MTEAERLLHAEQLRLMQALYGDRALPDELEPVAEPEESQGAE